MLCSSAGLATRPRGRLYKRPASLDCAMFSILLYHTSIPSRSSKAFDPSTEFQRKLLTYIKGFPNSRPSTGSHLTASSTMIPDHNNSPVDSRHGQYRCGRCGSNAHPSNWCWNKEYPRYHPGRSLDSTLHAFRVSDLPSGPPLDELKRPTCATCGGSSHYGVFGCPNGTPRPSYLPGPKTEWFPPAGKPPRR